MTANLLVGDVRRQLQTIPRGIVQTCITSPPYWGLRDYGVAGQIGSEKTPDEFIATMVEVFRLVRETLRDDGTLWLNMGDSYDSGTSSKRKEGGSGVARWQKEETIGTNGRVNGGIGAGNQLLMPHRVAMALQADGWILRSTVIWHKRSPMPESLSGWRWVQCATKSKEPCPGCKKCEANGGLILRKGSWRPTTGHEYVFLFSKTNHYYADGDAVAEIAVGGTPGNKTHKGKEAYESGDEKMRTKVGLASMVASETRNPRTVWTLSHEPYKKAHFATFPSELVRRTLLATTPSQCCAKCGSGYAPSVTKERIPTRPGTDAIPVGDSGANRDPQRHIQRTVVNGHLPTCKCNYPPARSIVLDPFTGSGTTQQVAEHYGRDSIGIELSESYAEMAREKIGQPPRCSVKQKPAKPKK